MIKLNLDLLDSPPAARRSAVMYGAVTGQVSIGRHVLQIGKPSGATIREASRAEQALFRPRPTPVLLRPRLIRGLVDRQRELATVLSALDAGLPLEASGERGIGKTALLRHVAHHPRAASFADGIVYVLARHQAPGDILQQVFEAFYEADAVAKPTEAEILRGLQDKQALILLDGVNLSQDELERLLDSVPRSAFVVATRERCLWSEVRSLALGGLPVEDAVILLEREMERPLEREELAAAESVCAALGGHPLRIQQAAAIARERGLSLDGWARDITPERLITELLASIDDKQRRALLALTALPGVPLEVQDISGIAEVPGLEATLQSLARGGLVVRSHSRYHLAEGVADRLRRTEDLNPPMNRAITYFIAWAERHRRSPDKLLEESETLLRAQHQAVEIRRWGEALRLGQLLEGALILAARWGAWGVALEHCLEAAKTIGDRSAEAWALHEIGIRAFGLGEAGLARVSLSQAVKLREALGDTAGAAVSRRNLGFVLPPPVDRALDLNSLPLRDKALPVVPVQRTHWSVAVAFTALLLAAMFGAGYAASPAFLRAGLAEAIVGTAAPLPPVRAPHAPPLPSTGLPSPTSSAPSAGASILIFTARPSSIATAGSTAICYAVIGASETIIEPGIGAVDPTSTLTCRRVAPQRTTTYELTAYGRDGDQIRQRLVIVVR